MTNIDIETNASSLDELSTFIKATAAYVQARDEESLMAVANHSFSNAINETNASLKKAWTRLAEIASEGAGSWNRSPHNIAADISKDCNEVPSALASNSYSVDEAKVQVARIINGQGTSTGAPKVADPYLEELQRYESRVTFEIEHIQRTAGASRAAGRFQAEMVRQKRMLQNELAKVRKEIAYVLNPTANKFGHLPFFFRFIELLAA